MGYNKLAPIYDSITDFVFNKAVLKAHLCHAKSWPKAGKILIVGGGTGRFLAKMDAASLKEAEIDYLDISPTMILEARKNTPEILNIHYLTKSLQQFHPEKKYDLIFTPFFLDNFSGKQLAIRFDKLNTLLNVDGIWIIADFQYSRRPFHRLWQVGFIYLMLLFFKVCCGISAIKLENFELLFDEAKFDLIDQKKFFHEFIFSAIYKKNS